MVIGCCGLLLGDIHVTNTDEVTCSSQTHAYNDAL
jgi:hypothetical protein